MRSDNQAEIGMHVFERAGLGKAPFRFVGYCEKKFQAAPDAPVQPGALGTQIANVADMDAKGRRGHKQRKTHCSRGHALNSENTYIARRPSGEPVRQCRVCDRERHRARYHDQQLGTL